ncbi:MAG: alpha/beta hydrolase [Desulfurococcaceae archaeon]
MNYLEGYMDLGREVKLFYRCITPGKHSDVLVIWLHGFTAHSGLYLHVARELASYGYNVCMYDQEGHGKTAHGDERGHVNSFEEFVKDLEQFTLSIKEELNAKKVILIGHSMGGLIVLLYSGKYGRIGDAVVGIAPAVLIPVKPIARIIIGLLSTLTPRKRVKLPFTPEQVAELSKKLDRELAEAMAKDELVLRDTTIRLLSEIWRASREFWKYVDKIRKPVLLIHGDEDNIIPVEASRRTYEKLGTSNKALKIYTGKGHSPVHEVGWRDCIKDIAEWIERILRQTNM